MVVPLDGHDDARLGPDQGVRVEVVEGPEKQNHGLKNGKIYRKIWIKRGYIFRLNNDVIIKGKSKKNQEYQLKI